MVGLSLMFLLPLSSWSFLAIRNCCSCSSLTAERSVATCGALWGGQRGAREEVSAGMGCGGEGRALQVQEQQVTAASWWAQPSSTALAMHAQVSVQVMEDARRACRPPGTPLPCPAEDGRLFSSDRVKQVKEQPSIQGWA